MMTRTWSSRPLGGGRAWRAAAAGIALLLLWAAPAAAVGVGGVGLSLALPENAEGRHTLALGSGPDDVEVHLRNETGEERAVRIYAVAARPGADEGSFSLGEPGSAPWFGLEDQLVDLGPRERSTLLAGVDTGAVPEESTHLAVVIETGTDSTLVTRAARVVQLTDHDPAHLPLWLVLVATALLAATVAGHVVDRRRKTTAGDHPETEHQPESEHRPESEHQPEKAMST